MRTGGAVTDEKLGLYDDVVAVALLVAWMTTVPKRETPGIPTMRGPRM